MAADISDPTGFMFVGDRDDNSIDVISIDDAERVFRIETSLHPDHIVVTPFAPILMYVDVDLKRAVFYDLKKQTEVKTMELPLTPRHVVLDTTGSKVAISDSEDGGFVLMHAYSMDIQFSLPEFPATGPVLFDPNDVDIYFSNQSTGSLGMLDVNTQRIYEMPVTEDANDILSAPSRSLDARYIYVANITKGEVYSLNAYSRIIFNTFEIGGTPARPYTTPQGAFLYMMDTASGHFISIEQHEFEKFAETTFDHGVDLVTVGRFDRMNLFLSTSNSRWSIFDNVKQATISTGLFDGTPIQALGSADGKTAYVVFSDLAAVAAVDLEDQTVTYLPATENGSGGFTIGLSNNVCH
jgi:hypothetical protein